MSNKKFNKVNEMVEEVTAAEEPVKEVPVKKEEVKPQATVHKAVVANCSRLNVRKSPSKEAPVAKILDAGTEITVYGESRKGWYKTSQGFVMDKFVKIVKE